MGENRYRKKQEHGKISAPVKVGEVFDDLEIVAIGGKGDGIGKVKNFVIIVPETQQGKHYKVEITRVLATVAFGAIVP